MAEAIGTFRERQPVVIGNFAGIIAFQSSTDGVSPNDLFVYRIVSNELFQVTNTPTTNEVLNDITVLPNGGVRLVWSTDGPESDVFATTFTLPGPAATYNFTGFFSPVDNLPTINTVKAGNALPVKFSLGGYQGSDILATGYPVSTQIACNTLQQGHLIVTDPTPGPPD